MAGLVRHTTPRRIGLPERGARPLRALMLTLFTVIAACARSSASAVEKPAISRPPLASSASGQGPRYPSLDSRLEAVGYRMQASGENVAEGYPSAAAVLAGWMTSPGHRANIVSTAFTQMGAGVATASNGRRFHAQVFGTPR